MNKGRGTNGEVRDWLNLSKPVKVPNCQKAKKPTNTVQPIQSSFPNVNKNNQQSSRSCTRSSGESQNSSGNNSFLMRIPKNSGVDGNIASNNYLQININLQKNHNPSHHQKKPISVSNPPKPHVPRKCHVPTGSGIKSNIASQNSVQINVNVSSNVKNTRPKSNNAQHAHNSGSDGLQGYRIKRMLGGNTTNIERVPYMLSMRMNDKHICGAVIIGEVWGLTAAHCCIKSDSLYVYSGSSSLIEGGKPHKITQVIRHEQYVPNLNDDYDICAVQVNPPFENANLIAATLPDPSVPYDDSRGLVTGWGYTEPDVAVLSPELKSLTVRKVDLERCKSMYSNLYTIHDRDVCYEAENKSGDACEGDSGGPLVNDDFVLLGIVSFGDECGYSTLPGVYTDTVQFRNWIKNKTNI